jgi:heterogeneous nuclear rnp K-like protein 2
MAAEATTTNNVEDATEAFTRMNIQEGEGEGPPKTDEEYAASNLTLRAIVSSKEAGVIIGKAGKNVADLRDETGVKAGVSKVVQGVHDRVLTVTGPLSGTAKAYSIVAKGLLEGAPQMGMGGVISNNGTHRTFLSCPFMIQNEVSSYTLRILLPISSRSIKYRV